MPQLFSNNARALLVAGISDSATSLTIDSSKADFFPVANVGSGSLPSTNNWFKAVLQDSMGSIEIVYVRTRTSGSGVLSNVLRGQEGTTARSFIAGAVVGVRLTAADINSAVDLVSKNNAFTGSNTFSGNVAFSGVATFSQTIVGNAATVTNGVYTAGDQTIGGNKTFSGLLSVTSPRLTIANASSAMLEMHVPGFAASGWYLDTSGITRLSKTNGSGTAAGGLLEVDASGNFTAVGDVTAYSDERLKINWRDLPADFLELLADLKMGLYERMDTGHTQAGVSAQGMRSILAPVVHEGADGMLSVSYGNAALVSCVLLARELRALKMKMGA